MVSTIELSRARALVNALPIAAAVALLGSASIAHAHIDIDMGGSHMSRSPGADLKVAPCGVAGSTRGTNIYTYRPGATVNFSLTETIPHPSYFRISFDSDGDDDFVIPSGTAGEFGDCGGNPHCGSGQEDYCSNETVLLDHLDAHAPGLAGQTYTWSVTLPNIECDNCTIQIIQMMNDFAPFHTPADYPANDIYYQCIDIVLSNDAPENNDVPVQNNGMVCPRDDPPPATPDPMDPMTDPMSDPTTDPVPPTPPVMTPVTPPATMPAAGGAMMGGAMAPAPAAGTPTTPPTQTPPMGPPATTTPAVGATQAPAPASSMTNAVMMPVAGQGPVPAMAAPVAEDGGSCSVGAIGAGRVGSAHKLGALAAAALGMALLARRRRT